MFLRRKTQSRLIFARFTANLKQLPLIMQTGFPSLVRQGLNSVASMFLNHYAGFYGDSAIAAMSIVNRICFFIFAVGLGIGQGFQPVCGFNYGAKRFDRVKKAFYFTVAAGETFLGVLAVVGMFLSGQLIGCFRNDAEVIAIGTVALRYQLVALFFQPITICATMLFQSVGANKYATFFSILRSGLIFIPILGVLQHFIGLTGVQSAQAIVDVATFVITLPVVIRFMKKLE
jgi:Na+-driven multidrug efflux pump